MAHEVLMRRAAEVSLVAGAAVLVWSTRLLRGSDTIDPRTGLVSPNGHKERRPRGAAAFEAQLRNFSQTGRGR